MKYLLAITVAFGVFASTGHALSERLYSTIDGVPTDVTSAFYDDETDSVCSDGNFSSGEVTEGWVCYSKDCYKSFESDVKICKDHAQKSARAVCERLSRDKSQCQLVGGDGQCCRKKLTD